jgi:hypothetical protein
LKDDKVGVFGTHSQLLDLKGLYFQMVRSTQTSRCQC